MNRAVLCLLVALAFALWRQQSPAPTRPTVPAVEPSSDLSAISRRMSEVDRRAMAHAYQILARSLAGDPDSEPVFDSTAAVRLAHRAALLFVWKGVLDNAADKYPGLREELEGALEKRIGMEDVPLNPTIRQEAVRAFQEIAAALSR